MSEPSRFPTLPSTVEKEPYVAVSWAAVLALTVSSIFCVLLLVLGGVAFSNHRPLLEKTLLILPVVGIVLSFAARRIIRNSEGTRSGMEMAAAAWWMSVIGGLVFGAYYVAIDFSIRNDAETEAEQWINLILQDDPNDPTHANISKAFLSSLLPSQRKGADSKKGERERLEAANREQLQALQYSDLVRLAHRNYGECEFVRGGVRDWEYQPNSIDSLVTGTVRCKEGVFPLRMGLKGVDASDASQTTGREWVIIVPGTGFFPPEEIARTPYGWLLDSIERSSMIHGSTFLQAISFGPANQNLVYHMMVGEKSDKTAWRSINESALARSAVCGGPSSFAPFITPDAVKYFRDDFFKLPGGAAPTPEQKDTFRKSFDNFGLAAPGTRIKNSADKHVDLVTTDVAVFARLPCELPLSGAEAKTVRCRIILKCSDPALVDEVKDLKSKADPKNGPLSRVNERKDRPINWQIVGLESDMAPTVTMSRPSRGGPGGPGSEP